MTFRSPVDVGRMAAQMDLLSGGRFVLGMGAGWNEAEHTRLRHPLPAGEGALRPAGGGDPGDPRALARLAGDLRRPLLPARWRRFLPKPAGRPPALLIGGGGEKRTLRRSRATRASGTGERRPETYGTRCEVLERHCEAEKRDPATIRRSMMVFALVGPNEAGLDDITGGDGHVRRAALEADNARPPFARA